MVRLKTGIKKYIIVLHVLFISKSETSGKSLLIPCLTVYEVQDNRNWLEERIRKLIWSNTVY